MTRDAKARAQAELAEWEAQQQEGDDMAHIHPDDPYHEDLKPSTWQKVKPTRKVTGATIGAAVGTIAQWLVTKYAPGAEVPPEVWAAADILLVFAGGWIPTDR